MDLLIALAVAAVIVSYLNSVGKRKAQRQTDGAHRTGESVKKPKPIETEFRALCSGYAWSMQDGDSFKVFTEDLPEEAKERITKMYTLGSLRGHVISQHLRDGFAKEGIAVVFACRKVNNEMHEIAFGLDWAEFKKKCPLLYKELFKKTA